MPTRPTSLTSKIERDPAVPGLDLSIALVKTAIADIPAAARPNAPPMAEHDAAKPTAASSRGLMSLLKRYWRAFQQWQQRQGLRTSLHDMSDRELMDIGLTRAEIDCIARHRAIDRLRNGTTHLWIQSRSMM